MPEVPQDIKERRLGDIRANLKGLSRVFSRTKDCILTRHHESYSVKLVDLASHRPFAVFFVNFSGEVIAYEIFKDQFQGITVDDLLGRF